MKDNTPSESFQSLGASSSNQSSAASHSNLLDSCLMKIDIRLTRVFRLTNLRHWVHGFLRCT